MTGDFCFDGSVLLTRPGFWAAHLGAALGEPLDAPVAALFGTDLGLVRGAWLRLTDSGGSPVFAAGAGLTVLYRNDDDPGVDYLLDVPGAGPVRIGYAEGVPDGPALSWPELAAVAARQADPLARARSLLLLAPVLGDSPAAGAPAVAALAAALRTTGTGGDPGAVAARLAGAFPTRWQVRDGARVCAHPGSTRNPDAAAALPPEQLRAVSDVLTPGDPRR
ncbi:hypothetical protein [Actinoplanes sp. DH11]|uniref:hypothetical protein n=1 Tax=Actinoplanes sp. DH11 TaxID=2857011 RepID=UPI001E34B5BE|nr:hypothetical protein [Actinoplanes sp. DH11]